MVEKAYVIMGNISGPSKESGVYNKDRSPIIMIPTNIRILWRSKYCCTSSHFTLAPSMMRRNYLVMKTKQKSVCMYVYVYVHLYLCY